MMYNHKPQRGSVQLQVALVPITITAGIANHIIKGTGSDRGYWVNNNGYQNLTL